VFIKHDILLFSHETPRKITYSSVSHSVVRISVYLGGINVISESSPIQYLIPLF